MGPRLWLVRHGETAWNASGRFQGQADPPLTLRGEEQAALVAKRLTDLPPAAIYTSDLDRCRSTAAVLARLTGLDPVLMPGLREVDVGGWSGLTRKQIEQRFPDEWASWRAGRDVARGGGETYSQLERRAVAAVTELAEGHGEEELVVVSHGGWIHALVAWALRLERGPRRFGGLANGAVSVLRLTEDRGRLEAYNDRGHLEPLRAAASPAAPS